MNQILKIDSLSFSYDDTKILNDIYFSAEIGDVIGIVGRNGCGKTTLFNSITINKETIGSIFINGKYVELQDRSRLIGYMPQISFLPNKLRVKSIICRFIKNAIKRQKVIEDERVGRILNSKIRSLSGGERRYLEFLLVDSMEKQITILDEPFAEIEPIYIEKIFRIIDKKKNDKCYIITDQNYQAVSTICTKTYLLVNGSCHYVKSKEDLVHFGYIL
jgi:ABC-type multidrug transport system ATPase subunit